MSKCDVCFRHCDITEGSTGFCMARTCKNGEVVAANYGRITSLSLDPIEKKPLNRFHPGSRILSVGSYGCNLRCPFCQNSEISWSDEVEYYRQHSEYLSPEELVKMACQSRDRGNIGLAFTYNEPLIGYEYILDTVKLSSLEGLKNVLVTNGTAELKILDKLIPYIDAMNIDLKGFTDEYYADVLHGSRQMVMDFIKEAVKYCHVELTTLIIPDLNDSEEQMRQMTEWIACLDPETDGMTGADIPLHISRFFPRFKMTDRDATDVDLIYRLKSIAEVRLKYVYAGNC